MSDRDDEYNDWIRAQATAQGLRMRGAAEVVHERPSSVVRRVPAEPVDLYFKAVPPHLAFEVALTRRLALWAPERTVKLVAADEVRRWLLMRDGGTTLREILRTRGDPAPWRDVLVQYARLQRELVGRIPELLAIGCPDRRLRTLPGRFADLIRDHDALELDQSEGITAAESARLLELEPALAALCDRLARCGIPETLHHDDLHDGNVFLSAEGAGPQFFDWGESSVAHPFLSLVIALRSAAHAFQLAADAPQLVELRRAYLEPWTPFGSPAELETAWDLAASLGPLCRALTWREQVEPMSAADRARYRAVVPFWLRAFLDGVEATPKRHPPA